MPDPTHPVFLTVIARAAGPWQSVIPWIPSVSFADTSPAGEADSLVGLCPPRNGRVLIQGAFVPTAEDAHDGTLRHILFCTKQIARKVFVSYRIKLDKER